LGVVDQVVIAVHPRNRLATVLGFIGGGAVPAATYAEAHHGLDFAQPLHVQITAWAVLGGLVFSAKTVFSWARLAFRDSWKAAGYVLLLEGIMITSRVPVLPGVLLVLLVCINGIATGCTLGLDRSRALPRALRKSVAAPVLVPPALAPLAPGVDVAAGGPRRPRAPAADVSRPARRRTTANTEQARFEFPGRIAS
jgi:hypothetical protein